ncbi:MAG: prepilin-type N-terminal cleavage/methylation domain-containing protein [bacterium]
MSVQCAMFMIRFTSSVRGPVLISKSAFTLIELLITVAIIGILAAVALPNFLNAQIRSKIAEAEAEMRNIETALESYRLDNEIYPPWKNEDGSNRNDPGFSERLHPLTTPISYMQSVPVDPFAVGVTDQMHHDVHPPAYDTYDYVDAWATVHFPVYKPDMTLGSSFRGGEWRLVSAGPDNIMTFGLAPSYDASNGLRSNGDLVRVGPRSEFEFDPSLIEE